MTVRAVCLPGESGKTVVRHIARGHVVWVAEGGPGWCAVRMSDGETVKVAEPAAEFAKRLATEEE